MKKSAVIGGIVSGCTALAAAGVILLAAPSTGTADAAPQVAAGETSIIIPVP